LEVAFTSEPKRKQSRMKRFLSGKGGSVPRRGGRKTEPSRKRVRRAWKTDPPDWGMKQNDLAGAAMRRVLDASRSRRGEWSKKCVPADLDGVRLNTKNVRGGEGRSRRRLLTETFVGLRETVLGFGRRNCACLR